MLIMLCQIEQSHSEFAATKVLSTHTSTLRRPNLEPQFCRLHQADTVEACLRVKPKNGPTGHEGPAILKPGR